MAEVQAIKNDDTIRLIGHLLRISDLLSIRFEDIHGDRLIIRESKTGKHSAQYQSAAAYC